jgi:hypothetical protein
MSNDYTYGHLEEVAHRLMADPRVTVSDLTGALANAIGQIVYLKSRLDDLSNRLIQCDEPKIERLETALAVLVVNGPDPRD